MVSGKLEAYGDEWQIIHPEVAEPGKGADLPLREPVYGADRGPDQPPPAASLRRRRWSARPSCPNGSSRASLAREGWRPWRAALAEAHREPGDDEPRGGGSPMTRCSPTSWRCCCCGRRRGGSAGVPLAGDGRLIGQAAAALHS